MQTGKWREPGGYGVLSQNKRHIKIITEEISWGHANCVCTALFCWCTPFTCLHTNYCFKHSGDKEQDGKWKLPEYFNVSTKWTNVPLFCFLFTEIMPNNPK